MENERVYVSQQLVCMLPPLALKILLYFINWQKFDSIKYYEKQMCKLLHLSKEELQLGIQTLSDLNLIDISLVDDTFMIALNKETIKKYFNVKMDKVAEHEGLKLSKAITWNKVEDSYSSISDDELEKMIQELQRRRNERKGCQVVYADSSIDDDLMF